MRLFIAIDLPQNTIQVLLKLQTLIEHETKIDARFVPPEQLHLTLAFLGDCSQEQLVQIKAALHTLNLESFRLCLHECGVFPDFKQPRVCWASVLNGAVHHLASSIKKVISPIVKLEEREFKPHITLARIKKVQNIKDFESVITTIGVPKECFEVVEFTLYQSELTDQASIHTILERFSLKK